LPIFKIREIIYNLMDCEIIPPFGRQGNKYAMRREIIPRIPEHTTYVEPFCGSGAIFFSKPKAERNVLNDLDIKVIERLNLIKQCPTNPELYPKIERTLDAFREYFINHGDSLADKLVVAKIETACGFCNKLVRDPSKIYKTVYPTKLIKNLSKYQQKLTNVELKTEDYPEIIRQYDSEDTFFFLDPPYESKCVTVLGCGYKDTNDFERLAGVLSTIRGKFLMTINDSERMRTLFAKYNIHACEVENKWRENGKHRDCKVPTKHKRRELIITNY